ncbi:hypothetical protein Misp01_70640 [Microtetraspora sp. NBRC 13810]|uniref:(2Fe-2S)-binding protein n=1 Tax=Microtetraspora sp. NBRC 13810 TaxID=3030990 RepID=UPI0024A54594|nr:(2Fe-2S)-binding protein [Microtetraspora sp. NBRC 13810]GLW11936.1 hypothetical protein Misp01_70640 [Microtetraspora sp. NBRC 13810]
MLRRALADLAEINPYFVISTDLAEEADPAWRPLTALPADTAALDAAIDGTARRLGTAERRVAASILYQGLAARLWSPVLGLLTAHGLLLDLDGVHWRPAATGPLPLWAPKPSALPGASPEQVYDGVMTGVLVPLADAVREAAGVARGLLWGNAASALAGTLASVVRARPELAAPAGRLRGELLGLGVLAGSAEIAPNGAFVRRSCCLYYRVPGGGMCGDCPLV